MSEFIPLNTNDILNGFYKINERGDIISKKSDKILKPKINEDGYLAISLCVNEIKAKGKEEYLAPVYAIGKNFDIDTDINLASIFHLGFTIKESTIEENQ